MKCEDCRLSEIECICGMVDKFFEENKHLMQDLARVEEHHKLLEQAERAADERDAQKESLPRCHACFFCICRCKDGHGARIRR